MSTRSLSPQDRALKNRRAFLWEAPQVPAWKDFFRGPQARRGLIAYWKTEGKFDLLDHVLFFVFQLLPVGFASALGGWIGRNFVRRTYPELEARARANLRMIRPDLDDAAIEELVRSHFDNLSRVHAEFPLLKRLGGSERLSHCNAEPGIKAFKEERLILLGLHTANWEISAFLIERLGVPVTSFYKPPLRAAQIKLALKVRQQLGSKLLPPNISGVREALRILKAREVVAIFGDEEHQGRLMAPFFGRTPSLDGNLAIAARLARMAGAKLVTMHGERNPRGHYRIIFGDPIALPSQSNPDAPLLDDVVAINDAIEPIIRANCGTWFYLHEALA